MGSIKDFFSSIFWAGDRYKDLGPDDLPRDIMEDLINHHWHSPDNHENHGNHYHGPNFPGYHFHGHHHWPGFGTGNWVPFNHHHHGSDQEEFDIQDTPHGDLFQEMDQIFQNFFQGFPGIGFQENFPSIEAPPSEPDSPEGDDDTQLRDKMLSEDEHPHSLPSPPTHDFGSPFGHFFGGHGHQGDPWNPQRYQDKDLDTELRDGKISLDDVLSQHQDQSPAPNRGQIFSQGFSSKTSTIVHGNGASEIHQTKKDSHGNEEVTVTRTLGDQSHSKTYKTDREGNQEVLENMTNMDQEDLQEFEEKWSQTSGKRQGGNVPMISHKPSNSLYDTVKDLFGFPR